MPGQADYDVIIVGAGPTGAVLGMLLGRAGHRTLVLERDRDVYPLPRAVHMDHEIMRVLQQIGLADAVQSFGGAVDLYRFQNAAGEVLLEVRGGDRLAASGYAASIMFVQPELEAALRRGLSNLAAVTACFGATAVELSVEGPGGGEPASEGVSVVYEQDGTRHQVRGRYLIGCDGASSWVRGRVDTPLIDLGFDEPWVVVDTLVRGDVGLPEHTAYQFCDPRRPTTCIPAGPGRRRWEFMLLPGETREVMQQPDSIWPLLAPWGGTETLELVRVAVYRFHAVIADRWRCGPVLLAGDAAHQTPPFMGQGLCSGIRDAVNLAWKLDRVLRRQSGTALLDAYQVERAPHVRHVVDTSVAMGRMVCELDPVKAAQRDAFFAAARASGDPGLGGPRGGQVAPLVGGVVRTEDDGAGWLIPQPYGHRPGRDGRAREGRMDDLTGCGFRLLVDAPELLPAEALMAAAGIDPVVLGADGELGFVETSGPSVAAWLAERGVRAALVRPDHYVFGTAHDAAGTVDLVRSLRASLA